MPVVFSLPFPRRIRSSAYWCPPCKAFSPVLADFYTKHASKDGVEIVYVSSDSSADDFKAYYGKMPWLAIPFDARQIKSKLASELQVRGIPTLIVLDVATGKFVTSDARGHVQSAAGSADKARQVVAMWKETTPVSFEEGLAASNDFLSLLKNFVLGILRNPIYIFGTIYMVKFLIRKLSAGGGGGASTIEDAAAAAHNEPIPDDEF